MQKYDIWLYALYFLQTPRSAHPQGEDFPDFYRTINLTEITRNADLMDYPYGMVLIRLISTRKQLNRISQQAETEQPRRPGPLDAMIEDLKEVTDPLIKGEIVTSKGLTMTPYNNFVEFEQAYGSYLITESQKKRMKDYMIELAKKEVSPTVNFKFRDINGKMVQLSDFKGKVVYVDVWATWCGPCKAEIPHLKRVEKEYHGKDVVFMSVSVDEEKNKQVWEKFVKDEGLGGVQLFAGDQKKDIMGPYKISGIPRFLLFGKDGKIINPNAPRPSNFNLVEALDKALAK